MMDDKQLLGAYARERSESAFGELVARHIDFVYSTALRVVNGDSHLAQDVTQTVFIDLARKAGSLPDDVALPGWLHRHTCYTATKAVRTERRRQSREQTAMEMRALDDNTRQEWEQVAPYLDESLNQLNPADRDALVLRFLKQQDLRSVGTALGISDDAAQKRVDRALEKLHVLLKHRGATLSAAALGTALATQAVTAAPVGLAASVTGTALASAAAGAGMTATIVKIMAMTKLKFGLLSLAVTAGVALSVWQYLQTERLKGEITSLRRSPAELAELRGENRRLAEALRAEAERPKADNRELLRLRGQVGLLRQAALENPRLQAELDNLAKKLEQSEASRKHDNATDPEQSMLVSKSLLATVWGYALLKFAKENDRQLPASLAAAAPYLNNNELLPTNWRNVDQISSEAATNGITIDRFELVYQGSMTNVQDPGHTILLREKEPYQASDGRWARTYVTATGLGGVRWSDNRDFTAVEKELTPKSPP